MNEIQTFTNEEFGSLRTVEIDGVRWFVGNDVAKALGYTKPANAVSIHVDSEDKTLSLIQGGCSTGAQNTTLINESGLYSLILSSKLPKAKEFKRWVTSEVLPSIRKTGQYTLIEKPATDPAVQARPLTPDDYIAAARIIAKCKRDRLPIVMELLRKGGWDLGNVSDMAVAMSASRATADISAILRQFTDAGGRLSRLSELTGINAGTLRSYRLGNHLPFQDRYNIIVNTIAAEVLSTDGQNQNQL